MRRILGVLGNARTKFFGALNKTVNAGIGPFWLTAGRFQSTYTGVVDELLVIPYETGFYKYAIYADAGDYPVGRLAMSAEVATVAGKQLRVLVPGLSVTSGTYYWLAGMGNVGTTSFAGTHTGGRAAYVVKDLAGYNAGHQTTFGTPVFLGYDLNMGHANGKI